MNKSQTRLPRLPMAIVSFVFLLIVLGGTLGWMGHGPTMLLTMAENGLSWCF